MLKTQEEIIDIVRKGQAEGKTFVVTNGCFDILHVGHVRYLQKTKEFVKKMHGVIAVSFGAEIRRWLPAGQLPHSREWG